MIRKTLSPATLAIVAALSSTAWAAAEGGTREGNGGGAIVCTRGDGSIESARLLDLLEAEERGLVIPSSDAPRETQLDAAIRRLAEVNPTLAARMRELRGAFESRPAPRRLAPPSDTELKYLDRLPRNCTLQGAFSFDDSRGVLEHDPEITRAMSPTDLAAADFHELHYLAIRRGPAKAAFSTPTRRITGRVFSTSPLPGPRVDPEARFVCDAEGRFRFHMGFDNRGRIRFQFTRIEGQDLTQTASYSSLRNGRLATRAIQGFPRVKRKGRGKREYGSTDTGVLRATSYLEPEYRVRLTASDAGTGCDSLEEESCSVWIGSLPNVFENHDVRVGMEGDRTRPMARVSCTPL